MNIIRYQVWKAIFCAKKSSCCLQLLVTLSKREHPRTIRPALCHMQITSQYSGESFLKLLIRQGIAKRIHGTIGIAQKV